MSLLCPYCGKPLQPTLRQADEYWCENCDCPGTNIKWVGSEELWKDLIETKKKLAAATDCLADVCKSTYDTLYDFGDETKGAKQC